MKNLTYTCDNCESDLTCTSNCVDYRLVLKDERIPSSGGAVTAMYIEPNLNQDKHFCGLGCLSKWLEKVK